MRSHYCGLINESLLGESVTLCGWVHRRRDHGGVIFVDLRDREGLVQVVFHPEDQSVFQIAEGIRGEYVIRVTGVVSQRPDGMVNAELPTGTLEVNVNAVSILNKAETPPFRIDEYQEVGEEVRLRYRFIDLRRPEMTQKMKLRSRLNQLIRRYLEQHDFWEIETPFLTKSTPEGARDYLVPSRVHLGNFYALPQSPQIFKQLLMVAGYDRYYQIVRCFRDEDLRADRQPEFTQLDIEMAFVEESDIQTLVEGLVHYIFKTLTDVSLPENFPHITYQEAISRFGTDRPDMRIPLELVDVADIVKSVEFKVFAEPANDPKGRVAALRLPQGGVLTRKQLDDYAKFVGIYGAKGLAYIKVNDINAGVSGLQSPILKFLSDDVVASILKRTGAENNDVIFFGADRANIVNEALGALRVKLGHDMQLANEGWHFVWVIDFPMFEWDEKAKRFEALHHPFTAPRVDNLHLLDEEPGACLSRAYDLVLNGTEIGGGSIRIHDYEAQKSVFRSLGFTDEEAHERFEHLLNGLRYGSPPHGGIAFGLDRLAMLLSGSQSIRDVIAFPKTQTAQCPLTSAPSHVSSGQLLELGLKLRSVVSEEK